MTEPFDPLALPDADDAPDVDPTPEPASHDDADQDDAEVPA